MNQTLEKLLRLVEAALAGDQLSADALRLVGEALLVVGGVQAMQKLQGEMHDYAVEHYRSGSQGSAIGGYWEHIEEWADL